MFQRIFLALAFLSLSPGAVLAGLFSIEEPRKQWIERSNFREDWPFMERRGLIVCTRHMNVRLVIFLPESRVAREDEDEPRSSVQNEDYAIISTRLPDLFISATAFGKVFIPFDSFEAHIARIAPFVAIGKALCDQPEGAEIGPGDL